MTNNIFAYTALALSIVAAPHSASAANPENPLVLVHGWSGTADYLGLVPYWNGFSSTLNRNGVRHYIASVSSFNSDEVRGEQLNEYIRSLRAVSGYQKFNLVGHSQGGLTIRKTAHDMPYAVSSLTTISSPHLGWKVADWTLQQPSGSQQVAATLGNMVGDTVGLLSGISSSDNDFEASMAAASTAGRADFNQQYPTAGVGASWCASGSETGNIDGHTQRYYSYTGNRVGTNWADVSDVGLRTVDREIMQGEESDGFVRVCASKFGRYAGSYSWNHLDEINQLFGMRQWFSANPSYVLLNHARRLAADGL